MTTSIVRRIDSRNKNTIVRDIDACLFYAGDVEWHFENAQLVIETGAFKGTWSIVKHSKPQWSGHNGYTFERPGAIAPDVLVQLWDITPRTAPIVTVEEALEAQNQARIEATDRAFDTLNAVIETVNACTSETETIERAKTLHMYVLRCKRCGALHITKEPSDAVYCSCAWREIEAGLVFDPTTVATPHKHRETVINRALSQNHYITDSEVSRSHTLRDVAVDFVQTYKGTNTFVQDLALRYSDGGSLSIGQMRGALNVMVREARTDTRLLHVQQTEAYAGKKPRETPDSSDHGAFYVNLAEIQPPLETQSTDRVVPNGTYTVPINDDGEYRVIKLTDCPESWNKPAGTQIAGFQSGADNESDFTGFAFVNGIHFKPWRQFFNAHEINKALDKLLTTGRHGEFGKIWAMASKKCFICGRKLTVPISKKAGIGPICAENAGIDIEALAALNIGESPPMTRAQAQADIDELFES